MLRGGADMHVGISRILCERNDLAGARHHLGQSDELGEANGLPQNRHRSRIAMAMIRQAEGDPEAALELLDEAERVYAGDFSPDVRPIAAMRTRVWITQGRLGEAWGWAREHDLASAQDLSYLGEYEHITFARLLLAQGARDGVDDKIAEAVALTGRLLAAASAGGRDGIAIDILVTQALALHARDDVGAARTALERALTLAEPEGYVRVFLDEGASMATLLRLVAKDRGAPTYARRLLEAIVSIPRDASTGQPLIEPLSERELEVLRLLGSDLDGRGPRPRAHGVAEHRPDTHPEHLREARREQPPGGGHPGRRARPAGGPRRPRDRQLGPRSRLREGVARIPGRTTSEITMSGDARSSHPL